MSFFGIPSFLRRTRQSFSRKGREPCIDCGERECPEGDIVCCVEDRCYLTSQKWCEDNGGRVLEGVEDCSEDPCEEPGNCCLPDGSCQQVTSRTCARIGGSFIGEEPCSSCPRPEITSQLRCESLDGSGTKHGIAEFDHEDATGTRYFLAQQIGGAAQIDSYSSIDCSGSPFPRSPDECYEFGAVIDPVSLECTNGKYITACSSSPNETFSCPVIVNRPNPAAEISVTETEQLTPISLIVTPTGSCEELAGGGSAESLQGRFNFLINEDTWVNAIRRNEGETPVCARDDCDRSKLSGACDQCDYAEPDDPEGCRKLGELCRACTSVVTPSGNRFPYRGPGASITGTAVTFYVSIAGNAGGVVDVLIQTVDPSNFDEIVECEIRSYTLPSSGGLESLCVSDELSPPEGLCMQIVSHAARGEGDPMMELPEDCPDPES